MVFSSKCFTGVNLSDISHFFLMIRVCQVWDNSAYQEPFGAAEVHGKAPVGLQEAAGVHRGVRCLQMAAATKGNCW